MGQVVDYAAKQSYAVKTGKYIAVRPPGKERFVRLKTLGDNYTEEAIRRRIWEQEKAPLYKRPPTPPKQHYKLLGKPQKITGFRALYFHYLYWLRKWRTPTAPPRKRRYNMAEIIKTDVSLVFENDSKVKVRLLKLDDSGNPLPGCVFNVIKDGQIIATEETKADGSITVSNVTEGMYAFVEVSAPSPFARLAQPVTAYVDQATVEGGGTVTVTAADKRLPNLTILKQDKQTGEKIPDTHFEIRGIHHGYHNDVTTGPDGTATLTGMSVDSYEVTERSVPSPYVVGDEPTQTIWLGPGDNKELVYDNLKQPLLTLSKIDADSQAPIPNTVLTVKALDGTYQDDWKTGPDGTVSAYVNPGVYQITEKSVPSPYYLPDKDADRTQTITLNAGDEKTVVFRNRKAPELTIFKENSITGEPIEHAKFHVVYTSNGEAAEAPATIDYGELYTDAKGEIRLHEQGKRLYPGEFTITEVEPADGFQLKEPRTSPSQVWSS